MNDILRKTLLIDFYGKLLTDKQRDMYMLHYTEDLSLSEIGDMYSITRQGARESIKAAERSLEDFESKLKLIDKYVIIDDILTNLDSIEIDVESKKKINKIKKDLEKIRR